MPLVLRTISDSSDAQKDLGKLKSAAKDVEVQAKSTGDALADMVKSAVGFIAVGIATNSLFKMSDAFTSLENKIRTVTDSQKQFNIAFAGVSDIALKTRNNLDAVASLYSKIALNSKQLGVNQKDTLRVTETVAKAIKLSGATAAEQSAVLLQFGQSVASGSFSGDELRSIREGAPVLAKLMADIFKVPLGDLKKLGEEGKLLAGPVLKGLAKGAGEIDTKFAALGVTFGESFSNLGTAFSLLFYEAKKSFLGSGNPMAEWLNNIALKIGGIAKYFQFYLALSKAYVLEFVFDSIDAFRALWGMLEPIAKKISDIAKSLYEEWKPSIDAAVSGMIVFASAAANTIVSTFNTVISYISGTSIGKTIIESFIALAASVSNVISSIFSRLNISLPDMNFKTIFAGLSPVLNFVKDWATRVYNVFYDLYDKLVGHSIVPDLIKSIAGWFGKLMGGPAKDVSSFAEHANKKFGLISFTAPLALGIKLLTSYKKLLLGVAAAAGIVALSMGIGGKVSGTSAGNDLKTNVTSKLGGFIQGLKDQVAQVTDKIVDIFNNSDFGHNVKQAFGIKDNVGGRVGGVNIDTSAQARVGRGPQRLNDKRDIGHDILNAFPPGWQIPILAALTGTIGIAIIAAFQAGTTRSVLLSVLAGTFLLAMTRLVSDSQIKQSFFDLADSFTRKINKGITEILQGNAASDPLGLLKVVAVLALLFKSGRKMLGKAAAGIITAPTKASLSLSTIGEKKYLDSRATSLGKEINALPKRLNDNFMKQQQQSIQALTALSILKDNNGQEIKRRARDVITTGNASLFGPQAKDAAAQAIAANKSMIEASKASTSATALLKTLQSAKDPSKVNVSGSPELAALVKAQNSFKAKSDALGEQIAKSKDAFVSGVKNFSAGVGGVVGGVAGYQFGATLAEGMTNAPAWAKLAITLGSSIAGQFLGSLIGLGVAQIFLNIFKLSALAFTSIVGPVLALTSPWILGAALITTALVAGYLLFTNLPEEWQKKLRDWNFLGAKSAGDVTGISRDLTDKPLKPGEYLATAAELSKANHEAEARFWQTITDSFKDGLARLFSDGSLAPTPLTRATGGWINGPGTSTSDSIPALLSKGEYVVNAKSAAMYGGVLSAINSGNGIAMLAGGGPASGDEARLMRMSRDSSGAIKVQVTNAPDFFSSIKDVFRNESGNIDIKSIFAKVSEVFQKMFSPDTPKTGSGAGGGSGGPVAPKTLEEQIKSAKTIGISMDILANAMNQAGFKDIKGKDLAGLSTDGAASLAEAIGKQLSFLKRSNDPGVTEFERRAATKGAKDLQEAIDGLVYKLQINNELPSTFKGKTPDLDTALITFGDQFKIISDALPDLGLSIDEFRRASDAVRENMFNTARILTKKDLAISNVPLGTVSKGTPYDPKVADRFAAIDKERKDATARLSPLINDFRVPVKEIKQLFEKYGITIQAEAVNMLTDIDLSQLRAVSDEMQRAFDVISTPIGKRGVTAAMRANAQDFILDQQIAINNLFAEALSRSNLKYRTVSDTLRFYGLEIEKSLFYRLTETEKLAITGTIAQLQNLNSVVSSDATTPAVKARAQKLIDDLTEEMAAALKESTTSRAQVYGTQFVSDQKDSFSKGIAEALHGRSKDGRSAWKVLGNTLLDNFTNGVIDTFSKGIADNVFVKPFSAFLKEVGGGVSKIFGNGEATKLSDVGKQSAGGVSDLLTATGATARFGTFDANAIKTPEISQTVPQSTDTSFLEGLSNAFQPIKDALGNVWSTLLEMLGISTVDSAANKATALSSDIQNTITAAGDQQIVAAIISSGSANAVGSAFAEGGFISGSGTGTSDSIAAMLSNGEFVVNAASTSRFLPLLHAINSGVVPKFADGGLVMDTNVGSISGIKAGSRSGNSQEINLTVVGDISRQTKSEIYGMLPQIAQGVNSYNRDKGYKG